MQALGDDTAQHSRRPLNSTVSLPDKQFPDHAVFTNVLMRSEHELLFFVPNDTAAAEVADQVPDMNKVLHHQWWQRYQWPTQEPFKVIHTLSCLLGMHHHKA